MYNFPVIELVVDEQFLAAFALAHLAGFGDAELAGVLVEEGLDVLVVGGVLGLRLGVGLEDVVEELGDAVLGGLAGPGNAVEQLL